MSERYLPSLRRLLWLCALGFAASAVVAGVRNYSSVPFGDMWPGDLLFYIATSGGDYSHWWAQHNEHRIVLSRLLFWIDLGLLQGKTPFLQMVNYGLAFAICAVLCRLASRSLREVDGVWLTPYLAPVIVVSCFSLVQYENLYWGFQSQFFLVYLLPLCAIYCLSRAGAVATGNNHFWLACLLAILSAGAMANGVLAAPVLFLQAILLRLRLWRLVVLAMLALLVPLLYFHEYVAAPGHGSLGVLLHQYPVDVLTYLLLYLGSPFHVLVGGSPLLAKLMGGLLVGSSAFFLWRELASPPRLVYRVALLAVLLFVGGSGLGTAAGRMFLGLEQALSYRYTTPALVAWCALLILYGQLWASLLARHPRLLSLLLLFPLAFAPAQWFFQHRSHFPDSFEGKVAVLSMQMGVQDQEARDRVAKSVPNWMQDFIARELTKRSMSVFAAPEMQRAAKPLGEWGPIPVSEACVGHVDSMGKAPGDERYLRFRGWLMARESGRVPEYLRVVRGDGKIVGYAVLGQGRPDVAQIFGAEAHYSGFAGYVLASEQSETLTLQAESPACQLQLKP